MAGARIASRTLERLSGERFLLQQCVVNRWFEVLDVLKRSSTPISPYSMIIVP